MRRIRFEFGTLTLDAELFDTPTAEAIAAALPINSSALTWGEEVYFEIPLQAALEADARAEVEVGELGYWPTGRALCIFFGPTPASRGSEPRAYSPVNVVGSVLGDATLFRAVPDGATVRIVKESA